MTVRLYQHSDRDAVRDLALNTADAGKPTTFQDPILLADLLTLFYTDHEPTSLWVAEKNGRLEGYLTGCLDTRRFVRWLKWNGNFLILKRMGARHLFKADMWWWVLGRIKTLLAGGAHQPEWIGSFPAHLHINLSEEARGHGVGSELIKAFINQVKEGGKSGIHLSTLSSNTAAQKFFAHHGFRIIKEVVAFRRINGRFEKIPVTVMGLTLQNSSGV